MAIKKGDKIKVDYEGKLDDGTVFDSSTHGDHSHPLEFEVCAGKVIKGFDEAVLGMEVGEEKDFEIKPEEGYGPINPDLVKEIKKEQMPNADKLKPGMSMVIQIPSGQQVGATVKAVGEDTITLDLNHPLAGKVMHFHIKIVSIE